MEELYREYKKPYRSILFITSSSVSDFRLALAGRWLRKWGYQVDLLDAVPAWVSTYADIIVVSRPQMELCPMLLQWMQAGKKVIIDMDDDFMAIPQTNPAYPVIGAGRPGYIKILQEVISKATKLTVAVPELATRYNRDAILIRNCWDEENELWGFTHRDDNIVNIGWVGTTTHFEDFQLVKDALIAVLAERPQTRVVIGLDIDIYNLFAAVPEKQKLFLPGMSYNEYPSFYKYIDIALVPLLDNYFNRAKSEIKLIEAGAAGKPWIASPLPFYTEWGAGGVFATTFEEWKEKLLVLIDNKDLRTDFGIRGNLRAMQATSEIMAQEWQKLVDEL